jgi:hypothetical protein
MTRHPALLILVLWDAGLGAAAQFGKISVIYDLLVADYGPPGRVAHEASVPDSDRIIEVVLKHRSLVSRGLRGSF